jgi:hypothetical protein
LMFISRPGAQLVLIQRNRGIFRHLLVTPGSPDEFVEAVRALRQSR